MAELKESDRQRLLSLTDGKDYGMCNPPMNAQVALNELFSFFLGENWYVALPMSTEQINTEIVFTIEELYKNSLIRRIYGR